MGRQQAAEAAATAGGPGSMRMANTAGQVLNEECTKMNDARNLQRPCLQLTIALSLPPCSCTLVPGMTAGSRVRQMHIRPGRHAYTRLHLGAGHDCGAAKQGRCEADALSDQARQQLGELQSPLGASAHRRSSERAPASKHTACSACGACLTAIPHSAASLQQSAPHAGVQECPQQASNSTATAS